MIPLPDPLVIVLFLLYLLGLWLIASDEYGDDEDV